MNRRWQPGVLDEVVDAILYLEAERPGLGLAFRALIVAVLHAARDPETWRRRLPE